MFRKRGVARVLYWNDASPMSESVTSDVPRSKSSCSNVSPEISDDVKLAWIVWLADTLVNV